MTRRWGWIAGLFLLGCTAWVLMAWTTPDPQLLARDLVPTQVPENLQRSSKLDEGSSRNAPANGGNGCSAFLGVQRQIKEIVEYSACRQRFLKPKDSMGGLGSQLHSFMYNILLGILNGYNVQWPENKSRYTSEAWCGTSRTFHCYFVPLPDKCPGKVMSSKPQYTTYHNPQERLQLQAAMLFNATAQVTAKTGVPFGLYTITSAIAQLVLKPNDRSHEVLTAKWARLGLDPITGWVGVHLRTARAKIELEGGKVLPEDQLLALIRKKVAQAGVETVFVASDSIQHLQRLPGLLPELKVVYDSEAFPVKHQHNNPDWGKRKDEGLLLMTEIWTLAKSLTFIGTLSSNLGRLVVELMSPSGCQMPDFVDIDNYLTPDELPRQWFLTHQFNHLDLPSWQYPDSCTRSKCLLRPFAPKKKRLNGTCPTEVDIACVGDDPN